MDTLSMTAESLQELLSAATSGNIDAIKNISNVGDLIKGMDLWAQHAEDRIQPTCLLTGIKTVALSREGLSMLPLILAIDNRHEAMVTFLLDHGAEPNTKDRDFGETPLIAAVAAGRAGNPELVRLLLERGADPNQRIGATKKTALDVAVELCFLDVIKVLLEHNASLTQRWYHGEQLRYQAQSPGSREILTVLLKSGAYQMNVEEKKLAINMICRTTKKTEISVP